MNTIQKITKNVFVLLTGDLITAVINFVFVVYVVRYLGPQGYGTLAFALAITILFSILADVGLSTFTTREIAKNLDIAPKFIGNVIVLKTTLIIIVFGLLVIFTKIAGYPRQTELVVYLVGGAQLISAFTLTFYSHFRAFEKMELVSIGQIIEAVTRFGVGFYVISHDLGIITLSLVYLISSVLVLLYSGVSSGLISPFSLQVDLTFWKTSVKQAWPFCLAVIFATAYYYVDTIMISFFKGNIDVGFYNTAYRLVLALMFIPNAFFHAVFPLMSRLSKVSKNLLSMTFEQSLKILILVAVPIGLGTTLIANRLIASIYGVDFNEAGVALQILIWSLVFLFINGIGIRLLNAINRQTVVFYVSGSSLILDVVLNLCLIPRYSFVGASIATVIAQLSAVVVVFWIIFKLGYRISVRKMLLLLGKVVIAGTVMALFIVTMSSFILWILVVISAFIYGIILLLLKSFNREDVSLLKTLIGQ